MTERPIIMTAHSVNAIMAGRKTQTRRVCSKANSEIGVPYVQWEELDWSGAWSDPGIAPNSGYWHVPFTQDGERLFTRVRPRVEVGDLLWVKETWCQMVKEHGGGIAYKADMWNDRAGDGEASRQEYIRLGYPYQWRSPMFMPRRASRLSMTLTAVRGERLQDICESDAVAEGIQFHAPWFLGAPHPIKETPKVFSFAAQAYQSIWENINAKSHPWDSNPPVWIYEWAIS